MRSNCGVCKTSPLVAKEVPGVNGPVVVTMCALCDARQCSDPGCKAYTADPAARECSKCRRPFGMYRFEDLPQVCDGDPHSIYCRHCGSPRTLEGADKTVGRRVLVCWTCDAPTPEAEPLVELGAG